MQDEATPYQAPKVPKVKVITGRDISLALQAGVADFFKAPLFGLFFGGIFAFGGLLIFASVSLWKVPYMIFPIAIGFPLIGPFVAAGLYEVSRRISAGEPLDWRGVLVLVFRQRERQLGWMAFAVLFIFWVWIYVVRILIALFMGFSAPSTIEGFIRVATTTSEGMIFLGVGTLVGAAMALFLFATTVISIPLLLDSELDFVTAMITSFKAVAASPVPMLGWGLVVTVLALIGMAPVFLGLLVIFPILGHATWHLYTLAVERT